ncbi:MULTISPECIES: TonB-dependent receptor [unclassified Pseudoalteromonas]|uniref:TonB-dependent receptor n=1 Tax=unclassified Pseudoalteromonas TaxID=194690 RepID=UPI0006D66D79|nr:MULTISPECIES: TonB-dependent receptor [unclassified Pseudoalteromonas]KPZ57727.1 TonB dependent receptor [Pseudoalteromonas sp. P1-25]KPZ60313.1 TonB dependent receptor [Pseudoalteromonas sp. P1-13-1a]KPZ62476.1 TonB dependent receptor [Pseudoalteromonas sp. P1-7a]
MAYIKRIQHTYLLSPLALLISGFLSPVVLADDNDLEVIEVHGHTQNKHLSLGSSEAMLGHLGVDFSAAGGVSNLPILNGLMGDRVKVFVDGADLTAACANQMNPPLSYISANQVAAYKVVAGVSPVSAGGDNIAGVISVNSISPQYSETSELAWHSGYVSAKYSSVDNGRKLGVGARIASDTLSFDYQGAFSDANSYEDGKGNKVLDTLYRAQNHSLTGAIRDEKQQLVVKLTHQKIPFQGFANQYMDMTDNTSYGAIAQYKRSFESSELQGQVNWHSVKHEMGFFSKEKTGMMPMKTDAKDISTQLKWRLTLDKNSSLLLGQEYYNYRIDDWWPAIEGSTMMGPNDYININNGKRERIALFAEYESQINNKLWLNTGVRVERVNTQVDEVQAYNDGMSMMDMGSMSTMTTANNALAANDFNNADRDKTDTLVDVNVLANYQITLYDELQLGLARKNRAPNLYERYSWGVSNMASTMIGWYGDANGYIGNPNLNAETAHTISATYSKTAKDDAWRVSANVWYTDINDYIDANIVRNFNSYGLANTTRNILQFTNVDATLYGAKLDISKSLYQSKQFGKWLLKANVTSTRGKRDDTNQPLYQIKPLHTELTLSQQIGVFENTLSWEWVDSKSRVDVNRLENQTSSYNLVNLSSKTTFNALTLSAEVTNLFDVFYELPLGGVSIAALKQNNSAGFTQLSGQGRSFNISASYAF